MERPIMRDVGQRRGEISREVHTEGVAKQVAGKALP